MRGVDEYRAIGDERSLDEFIQQYRPIVLKIAKFYKHKLPSHIEIDDLFQSGFIGLLEARRLYQSDKGATFETFASIKVRGAILDWLRKVSWGTRQGISNTKKIAECIDSLEKELGRAPSTEQIAAKLNMSVDEYMDFVKEASTCYVANLNEILLPANDENNPEKEVEYDDLKAKILEMLATLPEREKTVLSLYYIEELTLKEIAEVLGLTEARISQLHAQAIAKIQRKLGFKESHGLKKKSTVPA